MTSPSFDKTDSISEKEDSKPCASILVLPSPRYDWGSKERASIDTESLSEPEYPRPSRLYQCTLVLAGFFATFQTIGLNQTYGIFQASLPVMSMQLWILIYERRFGQDFYTSTESNITDGPGRYAMASLIGTIGGGLTWSGSVFVGVLISKGCNMSLMCLSGAAIMSLGFILASLATKVYATIFVVPAFG